MPKKKDAPRPENTDLTGELVGAVNILAHHVGRVRAEGELTGIDVPIEQLTRLVPQLLEDYLQAWDVVYVTRDAMLEMEGRLRDAVAGPARTSSGIVLP